LTKVTEKRVVLVSQDSDLASLIRDAFQSHTAPAKLVELASLAEARRSIASRCPTLVMVDTDLPDGVGTELLYINEREMMVPFLVLRDPTACCAELPGLAAGVMSVIAKLPETLYHLPCEVDRALCEWEMVRSCSDAFVRYPGLGSRFRHAQRLETMGRLVSGAVHEFNNVLTPVLAYCEMAMDDLPKETEGRASLEDAFEAATRAKSLVQQVLGFGRKDDRHRRPTDPASVVKDALRLIKPTMPPHVDIRFDIAPDCGSVLANPVQIHQVILNLCRNAVDAMVDEGGRLSINLNLSETDSDSFLSRSESLRAGQFVRIGVSDTGRGIGSEIIDRIFDPFFTTKNGAKGTGLGLAITRDIVVNHGGDISVKSEPGIGTTFGVYLPTTRVRPRKRPPRPVVTRRGTGHVLIVDDNEAVVNLSRKILERSGYQVTTRATSAEALVTLNSYPGRFDLLIADGNLSGLSSLQLAKAVRRNGNHIPIVLFGDGVGPRRTDGSDHLICGNVPKPFGQQELTETVYRVLSTRRSPTQAAPEVVSSAEERVSK
jgi:signal transduction histidine kinase/DNA-binding response OmpR family regulator